MKKILIATAVVATMMSGAVLASGPTLYGKIHTSIDVMDNGGSGSEGTKYNETSLNSNASRIGVKGQEDLGNGMKVGYLIEWQVDMTGDGGDMDIRNRAVTLSGDWGTALAGKWDSPMKTLGRKIDLFGDQVGDLRNMTSINSVYSKSHNDHYHIGEISGSTIDQRWDNVIQYVTPNMSGFSATVAYSFDTDAMSDNDVAHSGDNQDNDAVSFNVIYNNGPYMVGLGYEQTSTDGLKNYAVNDDDQKAWRLAGKYNITNDWDVRASYTDIDNMLFMKDLDTNVATIGTAYQMGNNKLKLQYSERDDFDNYNDTGSKMLTVGVDHSMSKRTTVYAAYSKVDNDDYAGSTPWLASHDNEALGSIGDDADVLSVGIIHKF